MRVPGKCIVGRLILTPRGREITAGATEAVFSVPQYCECPPQRGLPGCVTMVTDQCAEVSSERQMTA